MKAFVKKIKCILLIVFYLMILSPSISQTFEGRIVDTISSSGIENANISILESGRGTISNKYGHFSIENIKLPITLKISCIGYETKTYKIKPKDLNKKNIIKLFPKTFLLDDFTISDKRVDYIYKDRAYSILDFEIINDALILLTYKSNFNDCKLVTLNFEGDTLITLNLKNKAKGLYKDIFGNLHLISDNDNIHQLIFTKDSIKLDKPVSFKLLKKNLETYQFKLNEKYFFQDISSLGDKIKYGYIDENQNENIFYSISDNDRVWRFYDELVFNGVIKQRVHPSKIRGKVAKYYHTISNFEKNFMNKEIQGDIFNVGDVIYVLDETYNLLYEFNNNCELINQTRIYFEHFDDSLNDKSDIKNYLNWKWHGDIIIDNCLNQVYFVYKNSSAKKLINKLELSTRKIYVGTELKHSFIKKVLIYNNQAYYLYKPFGINETWALYKQKLK